MPKFKFHYVYSMEHSRGGKLRNHLKRTFKEINHDMQVPRDKILTTYQRKRYKKEKKISFQDRSLVTLSPMCLLKTEVKKGQK